MEITVAERLRQQERKIQELQLDSNRLLDEARSARRERDRARWEANAWATRALEFASMLRRVDPAWRAP